MRRLLLALVIGAAPALSAQAPTGPVAPAGAKASKPGAELRVSGFMLSGDR
jgi:hypothetical protein